MASTAVRRERPYPTISFFLYYYNIFGLFYFILFYFFLISFLIFFFLFLFFLINRRKRIWGRYAPFGLHQSPKECPPKEGEFFSFLRRSIFISLCNFPVLRQRIWRRCMFFYPESGGSNFPRNLGRCMFFLFFI